VSKIKSIATDQELNDKVIDACQAILKQKNNVGGLESSLLCQINGYKSAEGYNNVQIHFDSDRGHWVTSSTLRNRVEIADSLFNGKLSAAITNQLCKIYSCLAMDDYTRCICTAYTTSKQWHWLWLPRRCNCSRISSWGRRPDSWLRCRTYAVHTGDYGRRFRRQFVAQHCYMFF